MAVVPVLINISFLFSYCEEDRKSRKGGDYHAADSVNAAADRDVGLQLLPKIVEKQELVALEVSVGRGLHAVGGVHFIVAVLLDVVHIRNIFFVVDDKSVG